MEQQGVAGWGRGAGQSGLVPGVKHGVLGGAEPQQIPHLVAELGEVLPQVVEVLHCGLVRALHLLPCGGQVAVDQAAHDLLVVLIPLLLKVPPLLIGGEQERALVGVPMQFLLYFFS